MFAAAKDASATGGVTMDETPISLGRDMRAEFLCEHSAGHILTYQCCTIMFLSACIFDH